MVKIIEYDPIMDTVELVYTINNDNHPRIVAMKPLKELISKVSKNKMDIKMKEEDLNMVQEIIENGGMTWVKKEIRTIQKQYFS